MSFERESAERPRQARQFEIQLLGMSVRRVVQVTQRGESGVAIALAKTFTVKTVLHITSTIFDGMGARATSDQYKFDRYWRNARTISLHDPIAYKLRDIGKWCLSSELPPITPYS